LHTGRQHQIRVHAAHHGHPLVGDWVYGTPCAELPGQALHAALISFPHPRTGTVVSCESPWPAPLADLWQQLENGGVPTMKPLNPEQRARLHLPAD
jgi:23S rRNA pseudouridine1911/1915/1917 synthase